MPIACRLHQPHLVVVMHAGEPLGLPDPIALDPLLQDRKCLIPQQHEWKCAVPFRSEKRALQASQRSTLRGLLAPEPIAD